MKTDPRTEVLSAVGTVAYTLPDLYGGWTVTAVSGGTVTRAGSALTPGAVLTAGDALTFTPTATGGTTNLTIRQANAEFSGNYADLSGIPAGAGVDAEAVQDIVAAMLGSAGTYDDASGTYTLPPDQTLTPEQVQDIVGAFVAAGTNATVTYNDAANTLTISAAGGGSGGVTSVAGRTGAVTLTTADLPDLTEVVQDTVATMIQVGTGLTKTYNDTTGTLSLDATGTGGSGVPSGPVSLRYVTGTESNVRSPSVAPESLSDWSNDEPMTARVTVAAAAPLNLVQVYATIAYTSGGPISLQVYDGTGTTGANRGALLATATAPVTGNFVYSTISWVLDAIITPAAGQDLVLVIGETQAAPPGGQFRIRAADSASITYSGMTVTGWYTAGNTSTKRPWLRLLRRADTPKGTVNALDPADVPVVTSAAGLTGTGVALLDDGSAAPRLIRRRADNSVWYGPVFTSTP